MSESRIIPALLYRNGGFVKTREFRDAVYLGDALNIIRIFNEKMVDEVVVLDIDASCEGRGPDFSAVQRLTTECFMPITYGGGVRSVDDAAKLFRLGVEKVAVNTSALRDLDLVTAIAARFGRQAVVGAVDVVRSGATYCLAESRERKVSSVPFLEHILALERAGAGELLVQDTDRDGTRRGYDIDLFKSICTRVDVPVIALGGAADASDLARVQREAGASAAAAGSLFVFAGRRDAVLISMPTAPGAAIETHLTGSSAAGEDGTPPGIADAHEKQPPTTRRSCVMTVLDDSDPDFSVDRNGVALLAHAGIRRLNEQRILGERGRQKLLEIAERARTEGAGKDYDCLIGLSGGVDSSYVALMVKKLGLRPLALHLDNGWNSDVAVRNVKSIVDKLDIDLHTYVIDWEDVRDLQRSFFRASVPDVEVITDHAIVAAMYKEAARRGIKTMIFGINWVTESIMPPAWTYTKRDAAHIRSIHRRFGERKLTNFPMIEPWQFWYYEHVLGIHYEAILSYIDFNKDAALRELQQEIDYVPYPRKHGESRFTQFYQECYLPEKFGFDKRRGHLSSLIIAGQISRDAALRELARPLYDPVQKNRDTEFVRKKLGFSDEEWKQIMAAKPVPHDTYPGYYVMLKRLRRALKRAPKILQRRT